MNESKLPKIVTVGALALAALVLLTTMASAQGVENEFNVTTGWFATPEGKFGAGHY